MQPQTSTVHKKLMRREERLKKATGQVPEQSNPFRILRNPHKHNQSKEKMKASLGEVEKHYTHLDHQITKSDTVEPNDGDKMRSDFGLHCIGFCNLMIQM